MAEFYLHRTLCDVLEEMRACWKTRNFAAMKGLIEEAQAMGNRMESALGSMKDIAKIEKKFLALRREYKEANKELEALMANIEELRAQKEYFETAVHELVVRYGEMAESG